MKKILNDIKLFPGQPESELARIAGKKCRLSSPCVRILKKSLDARDKDNIRFVYSIEVSDRPERPEKRQLSRLPASRRPENPVLVVGSGPAGLFCAIRLLDRGVPVTLIERGPCVEERARKIAAFSAGGGLDPEGNVQFGEGGAGTFSDGKLNTGTHGGFNKEVLETFASFGAPEELVRLNKPHIGRDNLKKVVVRMREDIQNDGGRVAFNAKLTDVVPRDGKIGAAVISEGKNGEKREIPVSALVLAVGHSARDTFEMLLSRGVAMERKDFAVGVRIEHLQSEIGRAQYGEGYSLLPPADYKLVSHASERAAFTFCMCPGGYVMPAASEEGGVVTNGMSNYARDGINADSALVVQVRSSDFPGESPLSGIAFQRELERAAFAAGGGKYGAPVQLVGDFLRDRESSAFRSVSPTYPVPPAFADLRAVLPPFVVSAIKAALPDMDRRLKGFACPDAVLTAVESRTSSPVRILRGEDLQSVSLGRLYPAGEGAGYAGGITSSAADGLRVAEMIFSRFSEM